MEILLATRNQKKLSELEALLADMPVEVLSLRDFPDAPEVEETGHTFAENAEIKARSAALATGRIALADDSGLEVDALDGQPGVRSNRFAGPDAADRDKCMLVLDLMKDVPDGKRSARFRAAVAVASPDGRVSIVEGMCGGVIAREPKGEGGFGYDPIFYLPDMGRTMAELSPDEKNLISHRAKALSAARSVLLEILGRHD